MVLGLAAPRTRRKTVANRGEPMGTRKNQSFNKNHGFSNPEPTRGKRVETTKNSGFSMVPRDLKKYKFTRKFGQSKRRLLGSRRETSCWTLLMYYAGESKTSGSSRKKLAILWGLRFHRFWILLVLVKGHWRLHRKHRTCPTGLQATDLWQYNACPTEAGSRDSKRARNLYRLESYPGLSRSSDSGIYAKRVMPVHASKKSSDYCAWPPRQRHHTDGSKLSKHHHLQQSQSVTIFHYICTSS